MAGRPALFLDRDGTLNEMALHLPSGGAGNGEWESPHSAAETRMVADFAEAAALLKGLDWPIFVVSNQPSAAKGKCSFEDLKAVHQVIADAVERAGVKVGQWYYCYHHPEGILPDWKKACECRKPGTLFLRQAAQEHGLDLKASWFIGDQDFDIRCGRDAGCRSIVIENPQSAKRRGKEKADFQAASLTAALKLLLAQGGRP